MECRLLGYTGGHGNFKVQNAESHRVFVSCDVIFEEGQPHRTSPSVGENNDISLLDVDIGTLDKGAAISEGHTRSHLEKPK